MIHHLSGRLIEKNPSYVVIECAGVGYYINISLNTYSKIGSEENLRLLTHLIVREDAHILYGFATDSERQLFKQLISVSGIGAATAQMMLSSLGADEIIAAIVQEDVNTLKGIKGIGPKSAQRIILDLKDKLNKGDDINLDNFASFNNTLKIEALSALIALGFDKNTSNKMIDKVLKKTPDLTVEELVKMALQNL